MTDYSHIGAQVLNDSMLDCCFPYEEELLKKIEVIRKIAYDAGETFNQTLRRRPNEAILAAHGYSNAISILGSRGSGKTSIIMTIRKKLIENGSVGASDGVNDLCNIIMPLLVPHDIATEQSLLSWVIAQLIAKADEIEQETKDLHMNYLCTSGLWNHWKEEDDSGFSKTPLSKCINQLILALELRQGNRQGSTATVDESVYDYVDSVTRDAKLMEQMLCIISMIVEYYRYKLHKTSHDGAVKEPLLFFLIDDLDMAPERSNEVLNLILRYLQHPNLVVICGWNQELYLNHLSVELLKEQGLLSADYIDENFAFDDLFLERYRKHMPVLDTAKRLAMDNLKKAFPPALRYEIRGLSLPKRGSFPYGIDKNTSHSQIGLFALMEQTLRQCRMNAEDIEKKSPVPFLHGSRPPILEPDVTPAPDDLLRIYMHIFDNKARGLANIYNAFGALLEKMEAEYNKHFTSKPEEAEPLDITADIKLLLDTILFSNTKFSPYRRGLRDLIQIDKVKVHPVAEKAKADYYINFEHPLAVLRRYSRDGDMVGYSEDLNSEYHLEQKYIYFPQVIIHIYLLLNFMENLLLYITQSRRNEHGGLAFSQALNAVCSMIADDDQKPKHPYIRQTNEINLLTNYDSEQTDLISLALKSVGIERLRLFPKTQRIAYLVDLLNQYEYIKLHESNYKFTSFHSYEMLFQSVNAFFYNKDALITDVHKKLDLSEEDPKWLATIQQLFWALKHNEKNVKYLSAYKSIVLQYRSLDSVTLDVNLRKTAAESIESSCNKDSSEKKPDEEESKLCDADFNIILWCLRELDKNRSKFQNIRNKILRKMNLSPEDKANIQRANNFCEFEDDRSNWVNYQNSLIAYLAYTKTEENEDEFATILYSAIPKIDMEHEALLGSLETHLWKNLQSSLPKEGDAIQQYQCRMIASSVIGQYISAWELGGNSWGNTEIEAVAQLRILARNYAMVRLEELIDDIVSIGEKLSEGRREKYSDTIAAAQIELRKNKSIISEADYDMALQSLNVLITLRSRIRRTLSVEKNILDVLVNTGKRLAKECAELAWKISKNEKDEQRLKVWPAAKKYDKIMEKLSNETFNTSFEAEIGDNLFERALLEYK